MERASVIASIVALAGLAAIAFGGVAASTAPWGAFEADAREQRYEKLLPQHLAAVDAAIARKDLGRAVLEWRDAYGLALGSRRWEAMADVGDAAVRIDALASRPVGQPTAFRAEARQAYLRALFEARRTKSQTGISRIADAFAALGDVEMAERARTITVTR